MFGTSAPSRSQIENPILNSPYDEPRRHSRFDELNITSDIVEGRRRSEYTVAVAGTRRVKPLARALGAL